MGDGRISCLATAWQKTTKKISWKGMVEYHVYCWCTLDQHGPSVFGFYLLSSWLVYELSCSGLPRVDLFESEMPLPCCRSRIELDDMMCSLRPVCTPPL
jgi:hypothetical protein